MNLRLRLFGREVLAVESGPEEPPQEVTRAIGFAAAELAEPCGLPGEASRRRGS